MKNSVFEKTMKSVRKPRYIKLVTTEKKKKLCYLTKIFLKMLKKCLILQIMSQKDHFHFQKEKTK